MPLTNDQLDRYARHIVLREIGGPGQQKLLKARVLIVGAGGLGSPCALYLAAAGVGNLGLIDHDTVALSNLQRQILYKTSDIGQKKTVAAKEMLYRINPDVSVETFDEPFTPDNAAELVSRFDLVADGCDNFATRFAVNDAIVAGQKTLVSAAVGRFDGQLSTFKPHLVSPMGEAFPCYRCLVPEPPPLEFAPACAEAGIVGAMTGMLGSLQALEIIKEIVGIGSLAGRLLLFDGLSAEIRTVGLARDPDCPSCGGGLDPSLS